MSDMSQALTLYRRICVRYVRYSHCIGGRLFPGMAAAARLSGMACIQQLQRICVWYGVHVKGCGVTGNLTSGRLVVLPLS